jgi:hypothetical protein
MTKRRRSLLVASGVAVPLVAIALLAGPFVIPPAASPGSSQLAADSRSDRPSAGPSPSVDASPRASLLPSPSLPPITRTIEVGIAKTRGPFGNRIRPTGVWTGDEVIVWGGWDGRPLGLGPPQRDGAAFDPETGRWRRIAQAPIPGSADHLATWTGKEMLVWGGWAHRQPQPDPEGAAYDPVTDTWRSIAPAPVRWGTRPDAIWTGDAWVIALARPTVVVFAAYKPELDEWRRLPDLPGGLSDENGLFWTGTELLLLNDAAGLYRLPAGGSAWVQSADRLTGQEVQGAVSVDRRVIGLHPTLGLVAWDAASDTWVGVSALPGPASSIEIVENDRIVLSRAGDIVALSLDLRTGDWSGLQAPDLEHRVDNVRVWADDQLLVWGGWAGGPGPAYRYGVLYSPDW